MTPAYLSVSQLPAYLACPAKYRLRYVDQVEPAFKPAGNGVSFGTADQYDAVPPARTPPAKSTIASGRPALASGAGRGSGHRATEAEGIWTDTNGSPAPSAPQPKRNDHAE